MQWASSMATSIIFAFPYDELNILRQGDVTAHSGDMKTVKEHFIYMYLQFNNHTPNRYFPSHASEYLPIPARIAGTPATDNWVTYMHMKLHSCI